MELWWRWGSDHLEIAHGFLDNAKCHWCSTRARVARDYPGRRQDLTFTGDFLSKERLRTTTINKFWAPRSDRSDVRHPGRSDPAPFPGAGETYPPSEPAILVKWEEAEVSMSKLLLSIGLDRVAPAGTSFDQLEA